VVHDPAADALGHPGVARLDDGGGDRAAEGDEPDAREMDPHGEPTRTEHPHPDDVATKTEELDPFVPNWGSWTMPVTTPMAKVIRNSRQKNRARQPH
jgi:hypothetical protein